MGTKGKKALAPIVGVVADNVRRRVQYLSRNPEVSVAAWLRSKRLANGTVNRILKEESAIGIDTLQAVASILGLSAYQLLIPTLDAENPLRLPVTDEERHVAKVVTVALSINATIPEGELVDVDKTDQAALSGKHPGSDSDRRPATTGKGGSPARRKSHNY